MDSTLKVYCADIGSIRGGNFGWAGRSLSWEASGTSIQELCSSIARDLEAGLPVSLGFECPLFVPFGGPATALGSARNGEGARAWSAQAGASVLATGLVQVNWILDHIKQDVSGPHRAFLDWTDFISGSTGLFLWEAFVSGKAKGKTHIDDAKTATSAFIDQLPSPVSCIQSQDVYSLIGAALLRTNWSREIALLFRPATVIKA